MSSPHQCTGDRAQQARAAEDQCDGNQTGGIVEDADVRHRPLSLLPSTAMPWRAAAGARGRAEFGAGLARVGGLEDFAAGACGGVVGFARWATVGTEGQGFRAVHFVEMGFVDFGWGGTR